MADPIHKFLAPWHAQLGSGLGEALADLIAEDAVFYSPIVFAPQEGKALVQMYLTAAGAVFSGGGTLKDHFRYTKEVAAGHHAVLEFESEVDGVIVNGVDIVTVNDAGLVTEFKVMVRPMKAINLMRGKMAALLESMQT